MHDILLRPFSLSITKGLHPQTDFLVAGIFFFLLTIIINAEDSNFTLFLEILLDRKTAEITRTRGH